MSQIALTSETLNTINKYVANYFNEKELVVDNGGEKATIHLTGVQFKQGLYNIYVDAKVFFFNEGEWEQDGYEITDIKAFDADGKPAKVTNFEIC